MFRCRFLQDFILEHYSEDGGNYEEAIADLMETRQVRKREVKKTRVVYEKNIQRKRNMFSGDENTDQRRGWHRVTAPLLQPAVFRRTAILSPRSKSRYLLRMVRLVDRSAELPADRRLRESIDPLQRGRSLHAAGR